MSEPSNLTSRLTAFNPFSSSSRHGENGDDRGEKVTGASIAGGGHAARETGITKTRLRVSNALRSFLTEHQLSSADELLDKPHINVPLHVTDRSYPLPEYFISSSHNTYLLAHQLFGESSADAYENTLHAGARCIEIDAWDNDDDAEEPKVTHGYTLVSHISFRSVCETIAKVHDAETAASSNRQGYRAAPILLSLENHCGAKGQLRLVQIMRETWGDRLLSEAIRQEGHREQEGTGQHVKLEELGSKIVVIVEHHLADEAADENDSSSSSSEDEEERDAKHVYAEKKKKMPAGNIITELAELGVYAQSVKPSNDSWYTQAALVNGPHHHLINVSESGLSSHMLTGGPKISVHNAKHLMRVFPKGTRISSKNLNPVPFWGVGAQICALNWQSFGAGMQMNEALFSGSDGFVLKPAALRTGGDGKLSTGKLKKLRLHIAGATDVPAIEGHEADEIRPYVSCLLVHPDELTTAPKKRKTAPYKQHKLGFLHKGENPPPIDPVWDEVLEWEYEENEMIFLRMLLKSDASFATNPVFAVAAIRLSYAVAEWRFVRMLDLKGEETTCTLLIKVEVVDA